MPQKLLRIAAHAHCAWPLHGSAASRAIEAAALARQAPGVLMERAGLSVARLALAIAPPGQPITVLAGPGHNGGDGIVAARHLHLAGHAVRVWLVADAARLPALVASRLAQARGEGVPVDLWRAGAARADRPTGLVIDALLGLGASRAPAGPMADAIQAIDPTQAPVLAVDLPSGLNADTGAKLGEHMVRATHTLSLLTLKPGLFTHQGRDHAGAIWFDALGEDADVSAPSAVLGVAPAARDRVHDSHKGRYGDVAVIGGARGMTGAATLAASTALAAGAGRVFFSLLDDNAAAATARPELMRRDAWWLSPPEVLRATTVVCGCGGGAELHQVLPPLLKHAARLVLDADALNAIAIDASLRRQLIARDTDRGRATVLTPHPLEAARLLGIAAADVQADRLHAAQRLADELRCTVVLKGSGTVIASQGRVPVINPTGNGSLATAGTGDVLAGWLGGAWAQAGDVCPQSVASNAVWRHGEAADRWLQTGHRGPLRAADLVEALAGGP